MTGWIFIGKMPSECQKWTLSNNNKIKGGCVKKKKFGYISQCGMNKV